jgi:hypothetical protein
VELVRCRGDTNGEKDEFGGRRKVAKFSRMTKLQFNYTETSLKDKTKNCDGWKTSGLKNKICRKILEILKKLATLWEICSLGQVWHLDIEVFCETQL